MDQEKDINQRLEEKTLKSENVFDGKVLHVFRDDILLPNGKTGMREYCRHGGAVCVLPLTAEGEVICVKQFRYAHRKVVLEIPAGKLDSANEDHRSAAERELREETGAVAGKITDMGPLYTTPALINEVIYMYLAEDLTFGETDFDEDEFIESEKIPLEDFAAMVMRGEVPDAKTQALVMRVWALKHGFDQGDR